MNHTYSLSKLIICLLSCVLFTAISKPIAAKISESAKANQLFEAIFEQQVARSPLFQTALGRKTNLDKWDDLSEEFEQQSLALDKENLSKLLEINASQLDQETKLSYDLMKQSLENSIQDYRWRLYNYPVNQMFGVHSNVPSTLINQHQIDSLSDAQAYIARLNNLPHYFDQLINSLQRRADANIIAPKFVFAHLYRDNKNIIRNIPATNKKKNTLFSDFERKLNQLVKKDSSIHQEQQQALINQLEDALLNSVKPAYEKLNRYLAELEKKADTDDGVWRWKDGDHFFQTALQRTTTTELTAKQIHQIGLNEVARIHLSMQAIQKQVGFKGSLKEFMTFMKEDNQFYYANDEKGKTRYLKETTEYIDTMKTRLDELFVTKPKADLIVKAVEPFREQSAGKAFYQRPAIDGSRPGIYYANLYDMKAMPIYQMEALAYHEGIPGHHMQLSIAQELTGIPTFRKFIRYTAYTEGWGLYSEYLPKEIGMYSDPYSDFGRLAMELWRACRLVVDTGIHTKKWTRQQGIDYYIANTPNALSDAVKMVERHIVMPSQATAYKIGMNKIIELKNSAKQELGNQFDIRQFHNEILKHGPLPLNMVEQFINEWVASKKEK